MLPKLNLIGCMYAVNSVRDGKVLYQVLIAGYDEDGEPRAQRKPLSNEIIMKNTGLSPQEVADAYASLIFQGMISNTDTSKLN